jgi:hypothetical protein
MAHSADAEETDQKRARPRATAHADVDMLFGRVYAYASMHTTLM